MKIRILMIALFSLLNMVSFVGAVDEENQVNLLDLPTKLANALGIPQFAGQILVCAIFMFMFMLPTVVYTKTLLPPLFVGFLTMGFLIAVGWLPFWFLLIMCLMVALMFSGSMRDLITGKGRG